MRDENECTLSTDHAQWMESKDHWMHWIVK